MENKQLTLPVSVISPTDIARLSREVGNLDEFFRQSEIREGGTPQNLPRYSRLLDELVVANQLNLLDKGGRQFLLDKLQELQQSAPVMHISFSVDPPGAYVQKIVSWLRLNIDGLVLVRVGLMPNIGAGCVVRTTNKSFDFSLRKYFDSKHDFFMKRLHQVVSPELETEELEEATKPEDDNQQIGTEQPADNNDNQEVRQEPVESPQVTTETPAEAPTTDEVATQPVEQPVEASKEEVAS